MAIGTPTLAMTVEEQLAHDLRLILMYLSSWSERQGEAPRFWKGFRFEVLNQLDEEGFIQDNRRAKSAYLTDAGVRRARELLTRYGWVAADSSSTCQCRRDHRLRRWHYVITVTYTA